MPGTSSSWWRYVVRAAKLPCTCITELACGSAVHDGRLSLAVDYIVSMTRKNASSQGSCFKVTQPTSDAANARALPLQLIKTAVSVGGAVWAMRMCLKYLDPYREQREAVRLRQQACGLALCLRVAGWAPACPSRATLVPSTVLRCPTSKLPDGRHTRGV